MEQLDEIRLADLLAKGYTLTVDEIVSLIRDCCLHLQTIHE
jgi:hypothetical protein